ncbi:amino acid permease [Pseudarthrobacter oxydans]|jgi:APA family basic amino acid/polyamine antiporter|uniref:amino acid permease n=1 Tax=Pseudarthrobacter oxydans TaxID=1671 RepID=UPI001574CFA7|nr:amino acid permease [Pseudarthrobacter oxydans]MDV2980682.1 amino acid permease [Actinomycetes bacterium ARC8]NSX35765.1 amino acid permease [Pseudarthrobacter oxydans]WHP59157.1 amino acid permease [Arthrobacter sp. KFRI-F3372]BFE43946.1 amino acid permease [Pseudarthrobacter oxydans]
MSTRDMTQSIMRRKPIDDIEEENKHSGLFKSLGLWQLTAIGVGGIIGVGIFSLAGLVAAGSESTPGVGPAVLISFLVAGLASAAAALSYAEFAGMIPRAGSAYTYGYVALGEIIGWFIGWDLLLEYIAIVAVVAIGISGYFDAFLSGIGINMPIWMTSTADEGRGGIVNIPAIVVCLIVTWILSRGTKAFGRFELVAVAIKVILILFIIGLGVFYIDTNNYNPFMPSGFGPVLAGAATVFFAVFGYDAMSTAAEEAKDGKKHMPKAIILSLIIAMLLYVAATLVLTGMQNYKDIDPTAGFASAFTGVGLPVIATIISVFAVLSILTVMLTFLLGVTRVWFSMSRDGLLPGWFSKTDRHGTPQRVTWIAGVASALLAGVFPIKAVADLTNIGILAAFVVVCFSVIVFRYKKPDAPRTFRLPFMPFIPAFGVLASAFLMFQLHWETWARFGVWLLVGLAIYFFYGKKHSLMNPNSPRHQEIVEMHRPVG